MLQSLPASAQTVFSAIAEAQDRYHFFPPATGAELVVVVVGVSGGADSVCLVHALAQLAPFWQLTLHAAHMDHSLRSDSTAEAAYVAQLAGHLHIAYHSHRLHPNALHGAPGGLEEAARRARYTFLCKVARDVTPPSQMPVVAVAHHQDDQAETVLMNLIRGSGLDGLAGMGRVALLTPNGEHLDIDKTDQAIAGSAVRLVRPLLDLRRKIIRRYLVDQGLVWCEDKSNQDTTRLRNQMRHKVLPLLTQTDPNIIETLARSADLLAAEAERARRLDRQMLAALCLDQGSDALERRLVLDLERLLTLELATQRGVLHQALHVLQVDRREVGFEQIERLIQCLPVDGRASGPHPLAEQIAWTVLPGGPDSPARLSFHPEGELPLRPEHPYLYPSVRIYSVGHPLPCPGELAINTRWSLRVRHCSPDQLPLDWCQAGQCWQAFLDAALAGVPALAMMRPGQRFAPFGLKGHHKSLGDFFTDHKVSPALRSGWPLVVDTETDQILWVCGLEIAYPVRVTPQTTHILWLQWVDNDVDHNPTQAGKNRC